jgi:hypothetical protein
MEYTQTLIDSAVKTCHSAYKLCKLIGMDQGNLSKVRAGKGGLTFAQTVQMAAIVGVDPQEAWYKVSMERVPEDVQRDLWGKARATIGVAMLLFFVVPVLLLPLQSYANVANNFICYTSWNMRRWVRVRLWRLWSGLRHMAFGHQDRASSPASCLSRRASAASLVLCVCPRLS